MKPNLHSLIAVLSIAVFCSRGGDSSEAPRMVSQETTVDVLTALEVEGTELAAPREWTLKGEDGALLTDVALFVNDAVVVGTVNGKITIPGGIAARQFVEFRGPGLVTRAFARRFLLKLAPKELVLRRSGAVVVQAVDDAGEPIPFAEIALTTGGHHLLDGETSHRQTWADAGGIARVSGLAPCSWGIRIDFTRDLLRTEEKLVFAVQPGKVKDLQVTTCYDEPARWSSVVEPPRSLAGDRIIFYQQEGDEHWTWDPWGPDARLFVLVDEEQGSLYHFRAGNSGKVVSVLLKPGSRNVQIDSPY